MTATCQTCHEDLPVTKFPTRSTPWGTRRDTSVCRACRKGARTTDLQWTPGPTTSTRCTQTVLMQFGITDTVPMDGMGVLCALQMAGYTYTDTPYVGTVRSFVAEHQAGSWYIFTAGHAMAVIDGVLVDSEERGPDGRRMQGAYRIVKKSPGISA